MPRKKVKISNGKKNPYKCNADPFNAEYVEMKVIQIKNSNCRFL